MRFLRNVGWSIVFCFSSAALAANPIFHFDPVQEELSGTLDVQIFPGLPNYESIAEGDEAEEGFYFKLDSPIDVIATTADVNWETQRNVKVVQLILVHEELQKRLEHLKKGVHLHLKGKLSNQQTGHHHAEILLEVEDIQLIPKS